LTFKPSDIDNHPEYTYRMTSELYKKNLRISKYDDKVTLTQNNGSMERIVLRPICTPNCHYYALKSAEAGERYVHMPETAGETVRVQTRVEKNALVDLIKTNNRPVDQIHFTNFQQVVFQGVYFTFLMANEEKKLETTHCFVKDALFNLHVE